jgi:predicted ATPase
MLRRLYVDNFRCLVNFECQLATQQLILGPNGSGKSTLFDVLALIRDFCAYGGSPVDRFGNRSRTRWQDGPQQTFEMDVEGNGGIYKFRLVMGMLGERVNPNVVEEEVTFSGKPLFSFKNNMVSLFDDRDRVEVQYPFDSSHSALATIMASGNRTKLEWFRRWLDGLLIVSPDPQRMSGIAENDENVSHPDMFLGDFGDWYRYVKQRQATQDLGYVADLKEVIEGLVSVDFEDAGARRREMKIRTTSTSAEDSELRDVVADGIRRHVTARSGEDWELRDRSYLLGEMSEGQRVLIGLYAVLHFALKPGTTVCFDEPDNFIALREVLPWLTKVLDHVDDHETGAQVLIASHHPELLNYMAFRNGLVLDRPDGRNTECRAFSDPAKTGLTAAELVARGWDGE